jgi:hypothetical protein
MIDYVVFKKKSRKFWIMESILVWQRGFCPKLRQDTAAGITAAPSCRQVN